MCWRVIVTALAKDENYVSVLYETVLYTHLNVILQLKPGVSDIV